jgi:hypothetical protein
LEDSHGLGVEIKGGQTPEPGPLQPQAEPAASAKEVQKTELAVAAFHLEN